MSKKSRARRKEAKLQAKGMVDFQYLTKAKQKFAVLEEFRFMLDAISKGIRIEMRLKEAFYDRWAKAKNPDILRSEQLCLVNDIALELLAEARYRCRHKSFPESWRN